MTHPPGATNPAAISAVTAGAAKLRAVTRSARSRNSGFVGDVLGPGRAHLHPAGEAEVLDRGLEIGGPALSGVDEEPLARGPVPGEDESGNPAATPEIDRPRRDPAGHDLGDRAEAARVGEVREHRPRSEVPVVAGPFQPGDQRVVARRDHVGVRRA